MNVVTRLRIAVALCFVVLATGTVGYHFLEGWSYVDAFYMTVITIFTVGYSEVRPLSDLGHLFTVLLIFTGVGAIGYTATTLTADLVSGQIRQLMRGQRMEKRLSRLKDHVILCGYGKIGREIAREFRSAGVSLCVVDADERAVEEALQDGLLALHGDATEEHILERCGLSKARGVLTALPRDSDNLFVTLTVRELNPGCSVVARGLEPSSEARLLRAGADHVISPYVIGGRRMAAVLLHPEIMDFLDIFMKEEAVGYALNQLTVKEGSPIAGRTLLEAKLRETSGGAMVLGLHRDGKVAPLPGADTRIQPGDVLVVLGTQEMMGRLKAAGY